MIAERGQNLLETAKERGRVQNGEDYGRFIRGSPTVLRAPTDRTLSSTHCAHDLNRPLKLEQRHGFEVRVGVSGGEEAESLPPSTSRLFNKDLSSPSSGTKIRLEFFSAGQQIHCPK